MTTHNPLLDEAKKAPKRELDQRIESIGWALFFIWSGALLVAPHGYVPNGSWIFGTGLIIIGSMGIRYLYGIRIDGFWTVLGFAMLSFGIGELLSLSDFFVPLLLIFFGVAIGCNVLFRKSNTKENFWDCCWGRRNIWEWCRKSENSEKPD